MQATEATKKIKDWMETIDIDSETGRFVHIADAGMSYTAHVPADMTLDEICSEFEDGYDRNDYDGDIRANAWLYAGGEVVDSRSWEF